ncbi:hypothetical protein Q7689_00450 [Nocardiopsis tropica]|uniref:hypothetical protein n=1 Tax=Nocardiopsis tropica TaxID=109330 RepID=UPI002E8488EC|nr:hypothetical protein [Nocardiopsis tropica]
MTITLCGSVAHPELLVAADRELTLAGHAVLAPLPMGRPVTEEEMAELTDTHHRKIDMSDLVVAVRKPDGTIGRAVASEIAYAESVGVKVEYWEEKA